MRRAGGVGHEARDGGRDATSSRRAFPNPRARQRHRARTRDRSLVVRARLARSFRDQEPPPRPSSAARDVTARHGRRAARPRATAALADRERYPLDAGLPGLPPHGLLHARNEHGTTRDLVEGIDGLLRDSGQPVHDRNVAFRSCGQVTRRAWKQSSVAEMLAARWGATLSSAGACLSRRFRRRLCAGARRGARAWRLASRASAPPSRRSPR